MMSQAAFYVNVKGLLYRVPVCPSSRLNWVPLPLPPQACVAPPLELRRLDRHSGTLFSNPFTYGCVFNLHAQNCHYFKALWSWLLKGYVGNFRNTKLKKATDILHLQKTYSKAKFIFYCTVERQKISILYDCTYSGVETSKWLQLLSVCVCLLVYLSQGLVLFLSTRFLCHNQGCTQAKWGETMRISGVFRGNG